MRPFRIAVSDAELDGLRSRLDATRWPPVELETAWASGVPLAWLQEMVEQWRSHYDWRAREDYFNSHTQLMVDVGGMEVHTVVLRAAKGDAPAIVLTHGWPGTFAEYLQVAHRLANPESYGGDAVDAMTVVVPSLPGYGFSGTPAEPGWGIERIADAWSDVMSALHIDRFFAAGSDWGTSVSTELARRHPSRILGLTLIPPLVSVDPSTADDLTTDEEAAIAKTAERGTDGGAYSAIHATRPQTIAYGLTDSPAGLLAWLGEKYLQWAGEPGVPSVGILDAASIYWFTRTAGSSARLYRESIGTVGALLADPNPEPIAVPTGGIMFPDEAPWVSRRWAQRRFPDLRVWMEPGAGGHFGALEAPGVVAAGILETVKAATPPS
jgi:pimeloyl-ACP methyl ester carboxylesterase